MGGEFMPEKGQLQKTIVELEGSNIKGKTRKEKLKEFEEWKKEIEKVAKKYGAKIKTRERILMPKAPKPPKKKKG